MLMLCCCGKRQVYFAPQEPSVRYITHTHSIKRVPKVKIRGFDRITMRDSSRDSGTRRIGANVIYYYLIYPAVKQEAKDDVS